MVNDLPLILKYSSPSMFADDNSLFASGPLSKVNEILQQIKEDIMSCESWMSNNNA